MTPDMTPDQRALLQSAVSVVSGELERTLVSDLGIPLLISNRGYGIFWDNPADAVVAVGRSDNGVRIVYTAETGALVEVSVRPSALRGPRPVPTPGHGGSPPHGRLRRGSRA